MIKFRIIGKKAYTYRGLRKEVVEFVKGAGFYYEPSDMFYTSFTAFMKDVWNVEGGQHIKSLPTKGGF